MGYLAGTNGSRARWVLYLDAFLMATGFFMLIPLVSVHYTRELGMTATAVGVVLAVRMLTQQTLTVFGGALADRRGYKAPIVVGMLLRSAGFGAFAFAETFTALLVAAVIAALGGALFESTAKAALVTLSTREQRTRSFSLYTLYLNAGMTLGPLVGVLLLGIDFGLLSATAAAVFLLAGLQTLLFLPRLPPPEDARSFVSGLSTVWRDRRFVALIAVMTGFWFIVIQLYITLPLHVERVYGSTRSLGLLYAANSAGALLLQYPLVRLVSRRFSPIASVAVGVGVISLGLGLVPVAPGLPALLGCIGLFAAGRSIVEPVFNAHISEVAAPASLGSYFGFSSLALAFGGGFSNYAAGALYDLSVRLAQPALPWIVMASVGALVCVLLVVYRSLQVRTDRAGGRAAQPAAGSARGR